MNRCFKLTPVLRQLNSTKKWGNSFGGVITEYAGRASDMKDDSLNLGLDEYVSFVNKTTIKAAKIEVPPGMKKTVTTHLNLGVMSVTTVIEDK